MYVILLDNGRTKMLSDSRLRHALRCIKCGACANVCPVYRLVGGQAYESPYSGAIGKVVNPHLFDNPQHQEMTYASTLCGACEEVCPVQIDLPQLILHNRQLRTQTIVAPPTERNLIRLWHKYMLQKKRWATKNAKWKNNALQHFFRRTWGRRQDLPTFAPESFHEQWAKRK
jgi:L-lactate dehydrogenase complex protein LldF